MHFCSDSFRCVVTHMSQCAVNVAIWLTFLSQKIKIPKKNKISACVGRVGRSDFCCIRISGCKTKLLVQALPYIAKKSDWGYSPLIKLNHHKMSCQLMSFYLPNLLVLWSVYWIGRLSFSLWIHRMCHFPGMVTMKYSPLQPIPIYLAQNYKTEKM